MTVLTVTLGVLSSFVVLLSITVAAWAWRKFDISTLAWFVIVRAVNLLLTIFHGPPDTKKARAGIDSLAASYGSVGSMDFISSIHGVCNIASSGCLLLIAFSEISHLGQVLNSAYRPLGMVKSLYRMRILFGLGAVVAAIAPELSFRQWLNTL